MYIEIISELNNLHFNNVYSNFLIIVNSFDLLISEKSIIFRLAVGKYVTIRPCGLKSVIMNEESELRLLPFIALINKHFLARAKEKA
jgi:hypothetical protein